MELRPRRSHTEPVRDAGFETLVTHFAEDPAEHHGAAAPPIYQTSTFIYPSMRDFEHRRQADSPHWDYTRVGNPTTAILEDKLARLERGNWCNVFGSGMAAIVAAIHATVEQGSHVVAMGHVYGPTQTYLRHIARWGVATTFVSTADAATLLAAVRPETRLLCVESPTSGLMELIELAPIVEHARRSGIFTIMDNSWASPYFQNPLEAGIDLVVHSATKYLNGHSDVVAGVVVGRDEALRKRVAFEAEYGGATLDPHAAWLMLRGLRTLAVRMEQHQRSALEVARFLESHPRVARVSHPGLASHPQHALARRQMRGTSGLLSLALRDQSRDALHRFADRLRLFRIGVSWGGHESLVLGGTFFRGADEPREWLIRLSVGLESTADLIADLRQALED